MPLQSPAAPRRRGRPASEARFALDARAGCAREPQASGRGRQTGGRLPAGRKGRAARGRREAGCGRGAAGETETRSEAEAKSAGGRSIAARATPAAPRTPRDGARAVGRLEPRRLRAGRPRLARGPFHSEAKIAPESSRLTSACFNGRPQWRAAASSARRGRPMMHHASPREALSNRGAGGRGPDGAGGCRGTQDGARAGGR